MIRPTAFLALCLTLAGVLSGGAVAARTLAVPAPGYDIRDKDRSLGHVDLIEADDGQAYVPAAGLAAALRGKWSVKGTRGVLSVGGRTAEFARDRTRIVVQGQPIVLGSAPRIGSSGWLLPDDFLAGGLGRLAPGVVAVKLLASARRAPSATEPIAGPVRNAEPAAAYRELRYRSYPTFTRLVVEAGGPLGREVDVVAGEVRVKLPNLAVSGTRLQEVEDGLVKRIRLEPAGEGALLRASLEGAPAEVKVVTLQDPHRLVIDLYRPRAGRSPEGARAAGQGLRLIVIDPGHGGHDPGASGPSGLTEKEVVLDVGRRVARMVEEGLGIKVVMTRSTDVFIPLRDRTNLANRQRADLFVSIHANAHPLSVSEGVETFFLSSEATDNEARQVAASENGVVQLETPASRARMDALRNILWDLAQSEFQQESSFLAETVEDLMTQSLGLVNRGVKQAGFYVLGGAAMPAILIEVGFMTNPREERKLATLTHREALARAIYAGLAEYKRRYDQRMRTAQTGVSRPAAAGAGR